MPLNRRSSSDRKPSRRAMKYASSAMTEALEGRTLLSNAPYLVFVTLDGHMGEINYKPGGPAGPAVGQAFNVRPIQTKSDGPAHAADLARDSNGVLRLFYLGKLNDHTGETDRSDTLQDAGFAIKLGSTFAYAAALGEDGHYTLVRSDLSDPPVSNQSIGALGSAAFTPKNVNAMAFVPAAVFGGTGDPVLLGLGGTSGKADTLFRVNANTGATSDPVPLSRPLGTTAGMTCDLATGECFVADGGDGGTNALYALDPVGGDLIRIGDSELPVGVSGLALGLTGEHDNASQQNYKTSVIPTYFFKSQGAFAIDSTFDTDSEPLAGGHYYELTIEPLGTPTYLRPTVQILNGDGAPVQSVVVETPGQIVRVAMRVPAGETYRWEVSDADQGGGVGQYRVTAVRDVVMERESYGGPTNDTAQAADDLDPSAFDLGDNFKSNLLAARGKFSPDPLNEDWYSLSVNPGELLSIGLDDLSRADDERDPPTPTLEVYDGDFNLIATGVYPGNDPFQTYLQDTSFEQAVPRLFASQSGQSRYYIRVRNNPLAPISGEYDLVVARNANLNIDPENPATQLDPMSSIGPGPGPTARAFGGFQGTGILRNESDAYRIHLQAGQTIHVSTASLFQDLTGRTVARYLGLTDPNGAQVVSIDTIFGPDYGDSHDLNAAFTYTANATGDYVVAVGTGGGPGLYRLDVTTTGYTSSIAGRRIFYNNSSFDGNNVAANAQDDSAIAPDKAVLLPARTPTGANVTNFSRGINGLMIDVAGLPPGTTLTADDFEFAASNSSDAGAWVSGPAPVGVSVRPGAGVDSSDRVTLVWRDYNPLDTSPIAQAVANGWLRATVKATPHTGLTTPDVFYVGNLIADTGDTSENFAVTAADLVRTRNAIGTNPGAITARFDFNRDGKTDAADLVSVRNRVGNVLPALPAVDRAAFTYADFSGVSGLEFFGVAQQLENRIRMIPAARSQNGAFRRTAVQSLSGGFSTTFQFRYDNVAVPDDNGHAGTDGVAFTIQPVGAGTPVLAGAGVSVWFDAFATSPDISSDRVGIYVNGSQITQFDLEPLGIQLDNNGPVTAQINYDGATLDITVNGQHVGGAKVDLGATGMLGFAAFCGHAIAEDSLLSWTYRPGAPSQAAVFADAPIPLSPARLASRTERRDNAREILG